MRLENNKESFRNVYENMAGHVDDKVKQDRFYQYFYNLLETGNNYCTFAHSKLVKTIDEAWVTAIEAALPALQNVVQNPRRFMEEDRQVVNIAMARNITPESVRHLLQHSNMIDKVNADGTVVPNRILNVYKEESQNTYENRFISTLILELQKFVNKRFNVIFESSKDEIGTFFEMESTVDNYTEIVDYKLEIKIREKQTDLENEDDNIAIFTRISKIHRQVNDLSSSGFMSGMSQFPLVRHPIVKTNAIGKNKDYAACHKLWNYIHGYDRVGYKVDLIKQAPIISKEFENDIYNSFLWDYTMLRNYMEETDEINMEHKRVSKEITVKYIRQSLDEIIRGLDMPDASLRKLILNELTDLQLKRKTDKQNAVKQQQEKLLVQSQRSHMDLSEADKPDRKTKRKRKKQQ